MQIRKFYAKNVPAAMRDIRNLLGAEAVILSTRHLTTDEDAVVINGMRAAVEVTAAVDFDEPQPAPEPAAAAQTVRRLGGRRTLSRASLQTPEPPTATLAAASGTPHTPQATPAARAGAQRPAGAPLSPAPLTPPDFRKSAAKDSRTASAKSRAPLAGANSAEASAAPVRQAALRGILTELKSLQGALDGPDRSVPGARGTWDSSAPSASTSHGAVDGMDRTAAAMRGPLDHLVGQPRRSPLGRAAADLLNARLQSGSVALASGAEWPWPTLLDAYGPRREASPAQPQPPASSPAPEAATGSAESAASPPPTRSARSSSSISSTPSIPPSPADDLPLPAVRFRDHLLNQGVSEPLARSIIGAMHFTPAPASREDLRGTFRRFVEVVATQLNHGAAKRDMASVLSAPHDPAQGPRKVALVGPTGVGKTTTIAKIASYYALERNWNVALVTLDTYRVGAVEQLRIYARLLGVPLEAVSDFAELSGALERLGDADLVLIDTPGHGPGDAPALERLAAALGRQEALEVMLVVAATLRREEIRRVMRCFRPLDFERLIFSKLDEAGRLGEVLNAWNESGLEVSYFTAGQRVPEDLEAASAETLCRRLLARPA